MGDNEQPVVPWALGRVSEFPTPTPMPWAEIELDPATQTARYRMPDGTLVDPIEAGKHGRITPTYKPTGTHVDGGPGGGRKDSDTHTDGQPDQG